MYRRLIEAIATFLHDVQQYGVESEHVKQHYNYHRERQTTHEWILAQIDHVLAIGYGPALKALIDVSRRLQRDAANLSLLPGLQPGVAGVLERTEKVAMQTIATTEALLGDEPTTSAVALVVSRDEAIALVGLATAAQERALAVMQKEAPHSVAIENAATMGRLVDRIRKALA